MPESDENPDRVALIQRVTTAFLRAETLPDGGAQGRVESKPGPGRG